MNSTGWSFVKRRIIPSILLLFIGVATLNAEESTIECNSHLFEFTKNSFKALERRYGKSIFLINCGGTIDKIKNIGTGFVIDSKSGLLLTAYHVIRTLDNNRYDCTRADSVLMAYPIGDMCQQISLEYVNGDPDLDVALLRLKGVGSEVLGRILNS